MTLKKIPPRKDIADQYKWDLTSLFETDSAWEETFSRLEKDIPKYRNYAGRLHESVRVFREAVEFHLMLLRRLDRIYTYAHLKNDEDKANQIYLGLFQRAVNLSTRASEFYSFLTPEIQAIPEKIMQSFLQAPTLETYRFYLEKILRHKPHTLSFAEEKILAMSQDLAQAPSQVFGQLDNTDLQFGTLSDRLNNEIELSHGNFITFLIHPDRDIRRSAFHQYYAVYDAHKNTLAATLAYAVKRDLFFARVRNFNSCREAALFGDNVPVLVYDNLVETVRKNLGPLIKYLKFRKNRLDLAEQHFYDTYVPVVPDVQFHMPYTEAVDVCTAALAPLGDEYTQNLKEGLLTGWVDRYENKGKRSGAYASGCYDSPPYILLNYEEKSLNSLYTLIHEAGHAMHSLYSINAQPYVDHQYSIFVAEVASTFNEDLLTRYLLERYENDPKMKAYIINREIDNIRSTLFRQTMFAEFETIIHGKVEENAPLTLEAITTSYNALLQAYFGDSIVIDPELNLECLRIPHFYSAFYVYKYATGISAAIALAEKVVNEGDSARQKYLDFLKLGGSKFPLDELMAAGIDMRAAEPVQQAIRRFDQLVDELAEALA